MYRASKAKPDVAIRVKRTEGDFPHARRRSVWLLCGATSTTCCLTMLLGAGGGLAGLICGMARGNAAAHRNRESTVADILLSLGQYLLLAFGFGVVGLLIGAGIGFLLDSVLFGFFLK